MELKTKIAMVFYDLYTKCYQAGVEFQTTLKLVFNSLTLEEEPFLVRAKFILPLLLIF